MNLIELQFAYSQALDYLRTALPDMIIYDPYVVASAGGAAVVLGLKETTQDLDLTIPPNIYDALGELLPLTVVSETCQFKKLQLVINGQLIDVDFHPGNLLRTNQCHGVWIPSIKYLILERQKLNRPKDQEILKQLINLSGI
jgi:hypothetical protein